MTVLYDEEDEVLDEVYMNEDCYGSEEDEMISEEEQDEQEAEAEEEVQEDDTIEVFNIKKHKTSYFNPLELRSELRIMCEDDRRQYKIFYRDNVYRGVVVGKLDDDNYVFCVHFADRMFSSKNPNVLKKININEALKVEN